ncbi:MAG TPA: cytochrome c maturation protein CcmE [Levilinea sp.]|nr:cytochrome c maturation protein CcmE [Levilinea sp.]
MDTVATPKPNARGHTKFYAGGVLIFAAIVYLIITSTQAGSHYYLTVQELKNRQVEMAGRDVRISGVVLGDSIDYDASNLALRFTVAHIPGDNNEIAAQGGLALVLHNASIDASLPRLDVVYYGVRPDLLQNEAQAIMTGKLGEDGVFTASELLLKCPTKYEEALPEQAGN